MEHPAVETLARALAGLDADACVRIVEEVGRAVGPDRMLREIFLPALSGVGDIWARGLLDDLAFAQAAVITEQLWALVAPRAASADQTAAEGGPTVVIGVPAPDRHDIGKNQVARLLGRAGARVHDLGTEVEPRAFADKAKELAAAAVLVSASTRDSLARVADIREALDGAGARAAVLVGGQATVGLESVEGADVVLLDAYHAVDEVTALGASGRADATRGRKGTTS